MAYRISITGANYCDIVLYLMRILQNLGDSVLIMDHTSGAEFYSCIPQLEGLNPHIDVIDYQGVGYTRNEYTEEEAYSLIIDLEPWGGVWHAEDMLIIVADEQRASIESLRRLAWDKVSAYSSRYLLIKDFTGACRTQFREIMKHISFDNYFCLPFTRRSRIISLLAMSRDSYTFRGLSLDEREMLLSITLAIKKEAGLRKVMSAYKDAAGGKIGWN